MQYMVDVIFLLLKYSLTYMDGELASLGSLVFVTCIFMFVVSTCM